MNWIVEALAGSHQRDAFDSGHPQLDTYLQKLAMQHARKGVGRTFVAFTPGNRQVRGYYTLASSSIAFESATPEMQLRLPRYPVPVALIGKLAVDRTARGQGLGEWLLMDAFHRIVNVAENIAIHAVEVHAIDAVAVGFYKKYGFLSLQDDPHHLLLPMATIRSVIA